MFINLRFLIILLVVNRCHGYNFVVLADQGFLQPCDAADNLGNSNMEDLLQFNLRHDYADDMETLVTNGNITVRVDMPKNALLRLSLEILEWKRGKWEQTLFSIRRDDFCSVLFDPSELWYSLTMNIPEEDRICPPQKGTVYHMNDVENRIELQNINGLELEGQYKLVSHFVAGTYSTCVAAVVDIWKN